MKIPCRRIPLGVLLAAASTACADGGSNGPTSPEPVKTVEAVRVSPAELVVLVEEEGEFTATALSGDGVPLQGRAVSWSSSDPDVATVTGSGRVHGVSAGDAQITATIEGKEGTAELSVHNPVPSLTSVEPSTVEAGGPSFTLVVEGSGLVPGSVVEWNGEARSTTFQSAERLTAEITADDIAQPGDVGVAVRNAGPGGGRSSEATVSVEVVSNPKPELDGVDPTAATLGGPGFTLTVQGRDFVEGSEVLWNGSGLPTTFLSSGQLSAEVAAAELTVGGVAEVVVSNPAPGGGVSEETAFSVVLEPPEPALLDASSNHVCALDGSGAARCWGRGDRGQLGDGRTEDSAVPVAVAGGHAFREIAVGYDFTCGLSIAGIAYCWGSGDSGQLGNGTTADQGTPAPVSAGVAFSSIVAGFFHACGITAEGEAYCWGSRVAGELGDGETTDHRTTPGPVAGDLRFAVLSAGEFHTCGVTIYGEAYCWGSNLNGEVGDGTETRRSVPVPVAGGHTFVDVSAGIGLSCGVTVAGSGWCWGGGVFGELGNGVGTDSPVPVAVSGGDVFTEVTAGASHACGVTGSGSVLCWGLNHLGQLGKGDANSATTPRPVQASGLEFRQVTLGRDHTCGITAANAVHCWGSRESGLLGDGSLPYVTSPVAVSGGLRFSSVVAGGRQTCGLETDTGRLYCWGSSRWELDRSQDDVTTPEPLSMPPGVELVSLTGGSDDMCGLTADGEAYCWGSNNLGKLGTGTGTDSDVPVPVAGGHRFRSLSAGDAGTCGALLDGGRLYCWGSVLNGPFLGEWAPVPVEDDAAYEEVAAGFTHTCATRTDREAYCWGINFGWQFGNGTDVDSEVPVPMSGGYSYSALAAGEYHTCGLERVDGRAYCAGSGAAAGVGGFYLRPTPTEVPGGLSFADITAGRSHTCATVPGDTVYCWGVNSNGELGNGTTSSSATPAPVLGPPLRKPSSRGSYTCALDADGAAWCWGRADHGGLGNGTVGYVTSPVPVVW